MTLEDVVAEMVRLATAGGAGIWVVLLVLALGAGLVVLARQINWKPDPPKPPEPEAEWNTDPDKGAVVVPGPPGGSDNDVQSG